MTESQHRYWDIQLKAFGGALTIIGLFAGGFQYLNTHAEARRTQKLAAKERLVAERLQRDRAFRWSIWERKLAGLQKISQAAADVAVSAEKPAAFDAAAQTWERLYWGNLTTIDDDAVVLAMDRLRDAIDDARDGLVPESGLTTSDRLKQRAFEVSKACRTVIDVDLKAFVEPRGAR